MFELISVDDHLLEPKDLWERRLPEKFKEVGPRLVETGSGPAWLVEDESYPLPVKNEFCTGMGDDYELGYTSHSMRYEDMLPSFYDPRARAEVMQAEGIVGSVCFPTMPRFAGTAFLRTKDKELAGACIEAWNDFLIEEWCTAVPEFYIPMTLVQLWDPVAAAGEVRRNAARGSRAVSLAETTVPLGLPSYHDPVWDPMWEAIEETEQVVCLHIGTSGSLPLPSPETSTTASITLGELNAMAAMVDLIFGRVPWKFPKIQFVMSESGLGWVPSIIERADREWAIHRRWEKGVLPEIPPSEVFQRSFSACFVGDPVTVELRELIGIDRMMWECDYPHTESPFPGVQEKLGVYLDPIDPKEVDLITNGNARRIFNWPKKVGA